MAEIDEHVVRYHIWVDDRDGEHPYMGGGLGFLRLRDAVKVVDDFNGEEAANALMERRATERRFFPVRAITSFERVQ